MKISTIALSLGLVNLLSTTLIAHAQTQNNSVSCKAQSGALVSPVIELYTSESCSSCPPADKWVSSLKNKNLVVQVFHVDYWNHLSWKDRFSSPAYTARQREVAATNQLNSIYTPQIVLNGKDWPQWHRGGSLSNQQKAQFSISLERLDEQTVSVDVQNLASNKQNWTAYWTVTENGQTTQVRSGENAGQFLSHDFIVTQYQTLKEQEGNKKFNLNLKTALAGSEKSFNFVITHPQNAQPLQALSLSCKV